MKCLSLKLEFALEKQLKFLLEFINSKTSEASEVAQAGFQREGQAIVELSRNIVRQAKRNHQREFPIEVQAALRRNQAFERLQLLAHVVDSTHLDSFEQTLQGCSPEEFRVAKKDCLHQLALCDLVLQAATDSLYSDPADELFTQEFESVGPIKSATALVQTKAQHLKRIRLALLKFGARCNQLFALPVARKHHCPCCAPTISEASTLCSTPILRPSATSAFVSLPHRRV
eukprot:NODE_4142_length_835_cov_39.984463_g3984_i0.p1 GENE.NODE_4142_length_835_cov_39.984463_g3984_i0~~NODE_4142_length_835_cov_39.984463_g3984_i0.p1  ORF type:complete len:248 (-),score=76.34 NODE_4142_length_835_cov_39.984463_g3984_i0:92-781(-)